MSVGEINPSYPKLAISHDPDENVPVQLKSPFWPMLHTMYE